MNFQKLTKIAKKHQIFLLFIFSLLLYYFRIWDKHIYFTDELLIEDISYTMAKHGNFILPFFHGAIHLVKPPLLYWITFPLYLLLPPIHWLVRLWMPIFGAALVVVTYKLAQLWYDDSVAFLAAIFLATATPMLYYTKTANFDLPNAFFVTSSIYFYNLSKQNNKLLAWAVITLSFGILDRSFFGLFPLLVIAIDLFVSPKKIPTSRIIFSLLFIAALVLPWHILALIKAPDAFIKGYLLTPLQGHLAQSFPGDIPSSPFYIFTIFLWFPLLFFLLFFRYFQILKTNMSALTQSMIWVGSICVLFIISQSRYDWYLLPIFPACAILTSCVVVRILKKSKPTGITYLFTLFCVLLFTITPVASFLVNQIPQATILTAVETMEQKSTSQDALYVWHYFLFPTTQFFPSRHVVILQGENLKTKQVKFLLIRPIDLANQKLPLYKILFQTKDIILLEFTSNEREL